MMTTLTTFFDWLVTASLRASTLTLAVWIVQFTLQKHLSPRWRYALWLPVLIVLLAPELPESRWSLESVFKVEPPPVAEVQSVPVVRDIAPVSRPPITQPVMSSPAPMDWGQIQLVTWLLGAVLLLLVGGVSFLRTLLRFRRSSQNVSDDLLAQLDGIVREVGLRRSPQVLMAPAIQSPAVTGLLRPVLLLPVGFERDFSVEEARLILQHELTHLKRHDLPLNTVLCVLMALHWFNPLLWLAFFMARADREAACDAQVLENATPQRRSEYGHALLKIESAFAPFRLSLGFVGMLQRGATLRARIRCIAVPTRTRPLSGLFATLCISSMTFLGITRAEKSSNEVNAEARDATSLMALEVQIISFDRESNWDLGGRLTPPAPGAEKLPAGSALQTQTLGRDELNKLLEDTLKQPGAHRTAYPRMVVVEGKDATIRSVVNQPFPDKDKDGKNSIAYLPIGFAGNFIAKQYAEDRILLHIDITDSEIIGEEKIGGQTYPVARSSVYRASEEVPVGMSSAVYGWQEHGWQQNAGRIFKAPGRRPVLYIITPKRLQPGEAGSAAKSGTLFGEALKKADELRGASPKTYERTKSALGEVLQLLATDAGIDFSNLPEDHPASKKLITFNIRASPFKVLEVMCEANGLTLNFDQGVWQVRPGSFTIGKSAFRPADSIQITSLSRTDDMLRVNVDYELGSTDEATVALYITSATEKSPPFDKRQEAVVKKGRGSLTLQHPKPYAGMPHVTFYDAKTRKPIGGIYFGTQEEADASRKLELGYMLASAPPESPTSFIEKKLQTIILPSVQFRDAKLSDCIDYFRAVSKKIDTSTADTAQRGVNILLRNSPVTDSAKITLDLKNVPLVEALRYTVELANLQMTVQPYAVTIEPQNTKAAEKKTETSPKTAATARADKIILPTIEFRDATLAEAIEFIRIKSRDINPGKNGVNILLKGDGGTTKITLSLKNAPVSEALRYCAELARHTISADENTFVLAPKTK